MADAISDLRKRGYTETFEAEPFCLYCGDLDMRLDPADFRVDEEYEFSGEKEITEPKLIAITAMNGIKGVLIDKAETPSKEAGGH